MEGRFHEKKLERRLKSFSHISTLFSRFDVLLCKVQDSAFHKDPFSFARELYRLQLRPPNEKSLFSTLARSIIRKAPTKLETKLILHTNEITSFKQLMICQKFSTDIRYGWAIEMNKVFGNWQPDYSWTTLVYKRW